MGEQQADAAASGQLAAGVFSASVVVARRIAGFAPVVAPGVWERIGPQVRSVVSAAKPCTAVQAGEYMSVLAHLAVFAGERGHPGSGRGWLSQELIAAFAAEGCPQVAESTRAVYVSRLRRLAKATGEAGGGGAVTLESTDVFRPYTRAQLSALWAGAGAQPTDRLRREGRVLLALAAGCGLTGVEIAQVRAHDVRITSGGAVVVAVRGHAPRLVVARRPYEAFLAQTAAASSGQVVYLLRAEVFDRGPQVPARVIAALRPTPGVPPIKLRKLRASWLAALFEGGVALPVIVAAAGLDGPARLTRILPHLGAAPAEQAAAALRGDR